MPRIRRYGCCVICDKKGRSSEWKSVDAHFLRTIGKIFHANVAKNNTSEQYLCDQCYEEASVTLKFHNKFSRAGKRIKTSVSCDASVQTDSPRNILIVNGLPDEMSHEDIIDCFSKYSTIQLAYFHESYESEHFARLTYSTEESATRALGITKQEISAYGDIYAPLIMTKISDDETPIDKLSDDCLRLIFLKIDEIRDKLRLGQVCKRWRKIARQSWSNITSFEADLTREHRHEYMKTVVSQCGSFLTSLDLSFTTCKAHPGCLTLFLEVIVKHCPNLQNLRLRIHKSTISQDGATSVFRELLTQSTKLRRFSLFPFDAVNDISLLDFMPAGMKEIALFAESNDNAFFTKNLARFTDLKALDLFRINLGENGLQGIENLTSLERLMLKYCNTHVNNIRKITHFTKLTSLQIANCHVNDTIFSQISMNNPGLMVLDVSNNIDITDESFEYVQRLPVLKTLFMNNLIHVTGRYLAHMPSLEFIECNGCRSINDIDLLIMIDSSPNLFDLIAHDMITERLILAADATMKSRLQFFTYKLLRIVVAPESYNRWEYLRRNLKSTVLSAHSSVTVNDSIESLDWYSV